MNNLPTRLPLTLILIADLFTGLLAGGCAPAAPAPTVIPAASATPAPSATATLTALPSPAPTLEPTAVPEAYTITDGQVYRWYESGYQPVEGIVGDELRQVAGVGLAVINDGQMSHLLIGEQVFTANNGVITIGENLYYWNQMELRKAEMVANNVVWYDGRRAAQETQSYTIDLNLNMLTAVNANGEAVAFYTPANEWVVNPLLDTGYEWNFVKEVDGSYTARTHASEEWGYARYPMAGLRYLMPDQLPATFWDERVAWPETGSMALMDGLGNVYQYYAPDLGKWVYAGTKLNVPGGYPIVVEQGGVQAALGGMPYLQASESRIPLEKQKEMWRNIWLQFHYAGATANGENKGISYADFVKGVEAGKLYWYTVRTVDPVTEKVVETQINQNTVVHFAGYTVKFKNSEEYARLVPRQRHGLTTNYFAHQNILPDGSLNAGIIQWYRPDIVWRWETRSLISLGDPNLWNHMAVNSSGKLLAEYATYVGIIKGAYTKDNVLQGYTMLLEPFVSELQ